MKIRLSLVLLAVSILTTVNGLAQEITVTATAANIVASRVPIDMPGLANNPNAIIIAKPTGSTNIVNPIGAWYYNDKWHIFNTNHATMTPGSTFKVQVFLQPDANHFLHVITQANAGFDFTILDHPALNNNPNAQVEIFQNHSPSTRPFYLFPFRAEANYSTYNNKWIIQNVSSSNASLGSLNFNANTAFNVVISGGGFISTPPVGTPIGTPPVSTAPVTLPLNVVVKTEWSLPGFVSSDLSDSILYPEECRSFKYTNPGILKTDTVIMTPHDQIVQAPNTFGGTENGTLEYLEWGWAVSSQFVRIKLCNHLKSKAMVKGLKVNILVLR